MEHEEHEDFGGLHRDLKLVGAAMARRDMLRATLAAGVLTLLGCKDATGSPGAGEACSIIPEETEGPFPGDGSNGPDVLNQTGVVRRDIRSSFAGLTGTAAGVPLALNLVIVSASTCSPLAGYAVYVWHCDRNGDYSLYSANAADQNYLRGVQEADDQGKVAFSTIFPACYSGRWPHILLEVYPTLAKATSVSNKLATSQLALPKSVCDLVYNNTAGYELSIINLSQVSLGTDMVFRDGASLEIPTMTGSVASGLTATLTLAV